MKEPLALQPNLMNHLWLIQGRRVLGHSLTLDLEDLDLEKLDLDLARLHSEWAL